MASVTSISAAKLYRTQKNECALAFLLLHFPEKRKEGSLQLDSAGERTSDQRKA